METVELVAETRNEKELGSSHSRRLRRAGRLPVNLYGHGEQPAALHVDAHEFAGILRQHALLMNLMVGGKGEPAVIHAIQHDPVSEDVLHVDFLRVSLTEKVDVQIALRLHGPAIGQKDGGILQEHMSTVQVRCLPTDIPEEIVVDIRPLNVHDTIHVSDVVFPEGVEAADDPTKVVVTMGEPRYGMAEAAAEEGEEAAEPEVIGKPEDEGDSGGEGDKTE